MRHKATLKKTNKKTNSLGKMTFSYISKVDAFTWRQQLPIPNPIASIYIKSGFAAFAASPSSLGNVSMNGDGVFLSLKTVWRTQIFSNPE